MTPEGFAQKINEWARGTMIENYGAHFLSAGEGKARSQLTFKPSLTQLNGSEGFAVALLVDQNCRRSEFVL